MTNAQFRKRQFCCQTIHPTQKFTSMNLLQMSCVITWAWSFLISEFVEAVRGQKHHITTQTLAQRSDHPTAPVLLTKIQEMRSVMTFSLHSASISRILEPQGLISSVSYTWYKSLLVACSSSLVDPICTSMYIDSTLFQNIFCIISFLFFRVFARSYHTYTSQENCQKLKLYLWPKITSWH